MAKKQYLPLLAACVAVALVTRFFTLERYMELPMVQPEVIVNTGDPSEVLVFCPNGTELLSASGQRAQIKDIATGTVRSNLVGHRDKVTGVAVTPNGMVVVTGDRDGRVRLWEMSSGLPLRVMTTHRAVSAVAAGNSWVAAGLGGGGIVIWETGGQKLAEFHDQLDWITAMCVRADGALVSASRDGTVKVRRVPDGKLLADYRLHRDVPTALACNPQGSMVACTTESGLMMTWSGNSAEPQVSPRIPQLASALTYLDDHTLLTATRGKKGQVLRWAPGSQPEPMTGIECNGVLALSPGRTTLACNTNHRAVHIWDLEPLIRCQSIPEQPRLESVQFSADGRHLVVAADTSLCDWDLDQGKPIPVNGQAPAALSPLGKRWAYAVSHTGGGAPYNLQVADLDSPQKLPLNIDSPEEIRQITLSNDEASVYSSSRNHLRQFDTRSGKQLAKFDLVNLWSDIALSADQLALISHSEWSNHLEFLDRRTGQRQRLPISENSYARCLTFSPDGSRLGLSRAWDGEVYDAQKYRRLFHFECEQPGGEIKTLKFSPDDRTLAITRDNGQIHLLDGLSGKQIERLEGGSLAFSPDSRTLAIWGGKGLRMRSLNDGKEQILDSVGENNGTLSFSPDGKLLAAANSWSVRLFETTNGEQLASLLVLQPGNEWLVMTPAGLYDASPDAPRRLAWRMGDKTYKLEQFSKAFAQPNLLKRLIQGERPKPTPHRLHPAPQAKIISPVSEQILTEAQATVLVELRDLGGGIGPAHLLVNGEEAQPTVKKNRASFSVNLRPGPNRLRAYASDAENSMFSASDEITVFLRSAFP